MSKATRAQVTIGSLAVDGFMLPDGSYRMSQASAAEAIAEPPVYALRFLASKDGKALLGEAYTDYTPESIEVDSPQARGQTRINALPLEVVSAYWLYRSHKGNKQAFILSWALIAETLQRRFDSAFGVSRSELEYNDQLAQRISQLEGALTALGDAYASDDITRQERDHFLRILQEHGLDPYQGKDPSAEEGTA